MTTGSTLGSTYLVRFDRQALLDEFTLDEAELLLGGDGHQMAGSR